MGKSSIVPFMPEARLRELGGLYEKVQPDPWCAAMPSRLPGDWTAEDDC